MKSTLIIVNTFFFLGGGGIFVPKKRNLELISSADIFCFVQEVPG